MKDNKCLVAVSTDFTKEGYYALNREIAKRTLFIVIIAEIALILLDVFFFFGQDTRSIAIVLAVMVVLYPVVLYGLAKFNLARTYKINEKVFENAIYNFEFYSNRVELEFTSRSGNSKGTNKYEALNRVIENKIYMFIFIQKNAAYIIKKDRFASEEDIEMIRAAMKEYNVPYKIRK